MSSRTATLAVFTLALLSLTAPSRAEAQRIGGHFALGLGGDFRLSRDAIGGTLEVASPLDATLGFGVRAELPVHEYILVGGLFEVLAVDADSNGYTQWLVDIDALVKGRYPITLGEIVLEPYLAMPVGFTVGRFLDAATATADDLANWPGWNIGLMAGAMVIWGKLGAFLELGWRHHHVFHEYNNGGADIDNDGAMHQFAMNIGAALVLD